MQLFNISQEDKQLILVKQQPPQIARLALVIGVAIFFGWGSWSQYYELMVFPFSVTIVVALVIYIVAFAIAIPYAVKQLLAVIHGEVWTFDSEQQLVLHNGKTAGTWSQFYSVRAWEESDGEGTSRRLALQPTGSKPLVISNAFSNREWNELVDTAQRISAFTGIKLVRK